MQNECSCKHNKVQRSNVTAGGLNDHVVWPEPAQAEGIISCHEGEHELQTVNAGHDFTNNGSDEPLLFVIEKTVSFLKVKAF